MEDRFSRVPENLEQHNASLNHSQYPMLQPQFIPPQRSVPARDRYRSTRKHDEPFYDMVEDDNLYGEEPMFDSFDEKLLQQPYEHRQMTAEKGRARLTFPPRSDNPHGAGVVSQYQPPVPARDIERRGPGGKAHCSYGYTQKQMADLSHITYNATPAQESSSDVQLGASSSPVFKASQRRVENHPGNVPTRPSRLRSYAEERRVPELDKDYEATLRRPQAAQRPAPGQLTLPHAPPMIQGIPLVFVKELPDRLRTIFPFPNFNAVQSKCFEEVYKSDDNFVLSSPTGSGKTAILELAICRAINTSATGLDKIIYQAPTKALCSERQRDWQEKFAPLGLNCVELTGDSDSADLRNVQKANIIVTTPEKWDSITRKWKDHEKLMRLVKLFLIDEVHILNNDRGAVLETVVCRMKAIGTDVRFVALSATVPNLEDVAAWLGKNAAEPCIAANMKFFGEEFRPVKLRKTVCGYNNNANDYVFERFLDSKLPEVISKYSEGKPIMVFCCTKNGCKSTAKILANWWISRSPRDRHWIAPRQTPNFHDHVLREYAASGVAFHHGGLDLNDRVCVENGFLKGDINVICCTSTLAVGVNLPCHFVIIKNTVTFANTGLQEYTDLEIMQMLGRAGRPQFDNSAMAVIMTRHTKVRRYEMMVTGQELLESKLHLGLIDHLNAEVGLGTICNLVSARKWIAGTFLYVRIKKNPEHYKLESARGDQDMNEQLDEICVRDITLLQDNNLITSEEHFHCTDFGEAMARYYVHFETMKNFVSLSSKAQISEILSAIAQASEFEKIRFRAGEKSFYKNLNKSSSIRFQIPVNLALSAHKVSLMIQSVLGSANITMDAEMQKNKVQYNMELSQVFKHASRLIRCIVDCKISLGDSVSVNHALMLDRSLAARAWDDSPMQMKQIEEVGIASIMKFVNAGIRSMEDLESTAAHKIETLMSRNPPFGLKILDRLKMFPKLRVSLHILPNSITKTTDGAKVQVQVEVGFLNEKPPLTFNRKSVYVCVLAEVSDGRLVHFARIRGQRLERGQFLIFPALLTSADHFINCYVMCDEIAGTQREATVKPRIAPSWFSGPNQPGTGAPHRSQSQRPTSNMSVRRIENAIGQRARSVIADEFDDDGIDDDELVQAALGDLEFDHIENYSNPADAITRKNTSRNAKTKGKGTERPTEKVNEENDNETRQLENGKWACNHKCKDKKTCKHMCCREGIDKPAKKPIKRKCAQDNETPAQPGSKNTTEKGKRTQTTLQLTASKRKTSVIEELDMTQHEKKWKAEYAKSGPVEYRNLHRLHNSVQKKDPPSSISSIVHKQPEYRYGSGGDYTLSFMEQEPPQQNPASDYGDLEMEGLDSYFDRPKSSRAEGKSNLQERGIHFDVDRMSEVPSRQSDMFDDDDDSIFRDTLLGLSESEYLPTVNENKDQDSGDFDELSDMDYDMGIQYDETLYNELPTQVETEAPEEQSMSFPHEYPTSSSVEVPTMQPEKGRSLFVSDTSDIAPVPASFKAPTYKTRHPELEEPRQTEVMPQLEQSGSSKEKAKEREPETESKFDDDENTCVELAGPPELQKSELKQRPVPGDFKDLEPWFFAEFGDIIELVDE